MTIKLARMDGGTVDLAPEALQSFKAGFKGQVLTADDPQYEETRKIWNAMIDRRPGLVARCTGTVDVVQAVRFARQHGLLSSVRGGGHNIAGLAVCEGGLMIDMSLLRGVWVDPVRRTARAQAGCTLADVDRETQLHGLAAVLGFVSATGIAGLTVGGGFGYLTRRHGWTCDNVVSMDVVTAGGEVLHVSEQSTRICSGRCVAAAATSASSPPSSTGSFPSAPKSWEARSHGAATTPGKFSTPTVSSAPGRRAN